MTEALVPTNENGVTPAETVNPFVRSIMERVYATGHYVGPFAILGQALGADSLEEAMNMGDLVSADDHLGERIRFIGVSYADSDPTLQSRIPVFALLQVVLDDGTGIVRKMSTGAEHVLGVILRADEGGWMPFEGQFQAVKLDAARTALNLVPVPARVVNTAS